MAVHQLVPHFRIGDATAQAAVHFRALRNLGADPPFGYFGDAAGEYRAYRDKALAAG